MKKREKLKRELLESRRCLGKDGRIHKCEGQAFIEHECQGGLHLNEVIFPRNVFQKADNKTKEYFMLNPINLAINCAWFHEKYGHSKLYRAYFIDEQAKRFSLYKVKDFIENNPLKVQRR